jgi:hypothetical protein
MRHGVARIGDDGFRGKTPIDQSDNAAPGDQVRTAGAFRQDNDRNRVGTKGKT